MEDACVEYLLQLTLPAQQLGQLMLLWDKLMLSDARKHVLQRYAHVAWTTEIMSILPVLFEPLLHGDTQDLQLCKEVLFSPDCGAVCELQVGLLQPCNCYDLHSCPWDPTGESTDFAEIHHAKKTH